MSKQCLAGATETFFSMVNTVYILIGVFLLISLQLKVPLLPSPSLPLSKFTERECSGAKRKALKSHGPQIQIPTLPFTTCMTSICHFQINIPFCKMPEKYTEQQCSTHDRYQTKMIKHHYYYHSYHQLPVIVLIVSDTKTNNALVINSWNTQQNAHKALTIQEKPQQMQDWKAVPGSSHPSSHLMPVS